MLDVQSVKLPRQAGSAEGGVLGGVALILLVGAALGTGFNLAGLKSKPSWGLPWIAEDRVADLPSLGEVGPDDAGARPEGSAYGQIDDPMGMTRATEGVPAIPDLDRPIEAALEPVKQLFDAGAAVFIDAREPEEYAEGHIPGALSMPYDEVSGEPERLEQLDAAGRAIVVYCGGGACELSVNLAWDLIAAGQRRVVVYMGGFPEWQEAGYPVEGRRPGA